ncbi:hypothetical protein BDV25DRAFT_81028 [Aspergillus avenaceus]|uniref:Uncharacterized protein n=1 Tax=Aspergillus avenaceus TaxID=36643 RepID=A0A5N6TF06_ASPAV|nr:hypothetical protein BDV25DRAFT_81028 [Aspergillus avenaceus]
MQYTRGPESDLGRTTSRSRSTSMSSDSLPRINLTPPPAKPSPSFIASSSAAHIITADQEFNTADFVADDEGDASDASAIVTSEALAALNGFLDHLLFNILAAAKSTQLSCIRPAVAEVLKPRLAKEVVSAADEELSEYMGGPEDEQFQFRGAHSPTFEFDLIRSWKLTRLRCMVYTRLGDMEEDDEEEYIAQNGLGEDDGASPRFSSHVGNITPAAAIFLTSIIEHLGEQALVIAGETARSRLSPKVSDDHEQTAEFGTERGTINRLVVEDLDMEKLALNPTLGRLWRTWRRHTRSPILTRAASRESIRRRSTVGPLINGRKGSAVTMDDLPPTPIIDISEEVIDPASVALPEGEHDVEEIEVPGFTPDDGGEVVQAMQAVVAHKVRPHSLMVLTLPSPRSPTSPRTPQSATFSRHVRSRSLPGATAPEATEVDQTADRPSPTASEEQRRLETMYEGDEDGEELRTDGVEQEKAATSSQSAASVDAETSRSGSIQDSSTSLSDRIQTESDAEVIEGQGLCEKPKLAPAPRPKRGASKEAAREDDKSITAPQGDNERGLQTVVGDAPRTQGVNSTPAQPAVSQGTSNVIDINETTTESLASQTQPPTDEVAIERFSRPVSASGESGHSDLPRRPRPTPLPGVSLHRYGHSSPGVPSISSGTERAAVQRVIRPSTSAASSIYSKSRRSSSFSSQREKRPLTAGSTTSQVSSKLKGLIGLQGECASHRLRSSSETNRAFSVAGDPYDDTSGLDELIRSEETLHYTLTPKNMREIEEPDSPRWRGIRSSTAELSESHKGPAPTNEGTPRHSTSNTSNRSPVSKSKTSDLAKHTPIEIPPTADSLQTSNLDQTADAKPNIEATGDYAKSLRSSGPSSPVSTKTMTRTPTSQSSQPRASTGTNHSGPKLQARPAVSPREDITSDLIDFIREGPPNAGARRIPRTVAPFRDTMDSDELNSLDTSADNRAHSVTSKDGSVLTSVGSRTGLLESTSQPAAQPSTTKPTPTGASDGPFPARKQRRVPDPYAIDSDDDDDFEELLSGPPKPKREEESLMDFLRNVPPPESEPTPQPLAVNTVPSKGSFGMKARLLRNTPADKVSATQSSKPPPRQQDSYAGASSNYSVKVSAERSRRPTYASGLPSATDRQTETSALAEFLRTTGPPEPFIPPRATSSLNSRGKESGGNSFSRLFTRRKKVEV